MAVLQRQRKRGDCGIAALSQYLHIPYEDVYVAAVKLFPDVAKTGLLLREMQDVAAALKRPLVIKRRADLEQDSGVLGILWRKRKGQSQKGHWVALLEGKVIDGDPVPEVWVDADEYLAAYQARPGWLLTEEPQ